MHPKHPPLNILPYKHSLNHDAPRSSPHAVLSSSEYHSYHAVCQVQESPVPCYLPRAWVAGGKTFKTSFKISVSKTKKASFLTYSFSAASRTVLYRLYGRDAQKICAQRSFYTSLMYILRNNKWNGCNCFRKSFQKTQVCLAFNIKYFHNLNLQHWMASSIAKTTIC